MEASVFAEEMCNELVSISASQESPALILQGTDKKGQPFLDVLIECELKQVKTLKIFQDNLQLIFSFSNLRSLPIQQCKPTLLSSGKAV